MIKSKAVSKRLRPLLGTFVEITLFNDGDFDLLMTQAFQSAEDLQQIFNIHDPESEISKINAGVLQTRSPSLSFLMEQAKKIAEVSEGAFQCQTDRGWDLNGVAKGFIVDQMVQALLEGEPSLSGIVNAGGDLRFFNYSERAATLRLGSFEAPVIRELKLVRDAIASSSLSVSLQDQKSSTHYTKSLRAGLSPFHTVSVVASDCMTADALTKVGLFATSEVVQKCASVFDAQVIIFDPEGNPVEVFEKS